MSDKERYRLLCRSESSIPLFCRDWWLDAICGEECWDAVTVESDGRIIAALPYHVRDRFGFTVISMPSLTQFMGPWLSYPSGQKHAARLSFEKKAITELLAKLPPYDDLTQRCHHSLTNWLPFYWQGFRQTTRYTYVLEDPADLRKVWDGFEHTTRNIIRKAEKSGVRIVQSDDLDLFLDLNEKVFHRQGLRLPYGRDDVARLDAACKERQSRKIFIALNGEGAPIGGLYCVFDEKVMYHLMQGADPLHRSSGAMPLLTWVSVQEAAAAGKSYDFEGSMIEPVEAFVRSFGAVQRPYFQIGKTNSLLIRLARFGAELVGKA